LTLSSVGTIIFAGQIFPNFPTSK